MSRGLPRGLPVPVRSWAWRAALCVLLAVAGPAFAQETPPPAPAAPSETPEAAPPAPTAPKPPLQGLQAPALPGPSQAAAPESPGGAPTAPGKTPVAPPVPPAAQFPSLKIGPSPEAPAEEEAAAPAMPAGPEPRITLSMAEVKAISDVREKNRGKDPAATAAAAEAYLNDYPEGAYRDEALLALGDAQLAQGQADAASATYKRIIDEFPDSALREYAMAQSYSALQKSGDPAAADARLNTLVQEYPHGLTHARAEFWKARARAGENDPIALVAAMEEVDREQLPTDQDKAEYDRLMGMALVRAGQRERAEPFLSRYLEADDTAEHKAPVLMMLGDEARQQKRFEDALGYYQQIVSRYPHPPLLPEAQFWRAEMFARAKLDPAPPDQREDVRRQAIVNYSAYLDSGDTAFRARALQRRAELLTDAGRNEEALRDYDLLFALDPAYQNEPSVITARAGLLVKLGREQEAVALLNQAGQNPEIGAGERGDLLIEQARVHYEKENCPEVLRLLQPLPAFENVDQVNQAVFMRGFCYFRQGQWEEASADLEVLARYPKQLPTVWEPLVESYERSGQYSRLVRFLEEQIAAKRIEPTAKTYNQLALGYERLNQPALVISTYQKLGETDPEALKTPEAQVRLGKAEEATGRPDQAAEQYEAALAPRDPAQPPGDAQRDALERLRALLSRTGQWERLVTEIDTVEPNFTEPEDRARLREAKREAYLGWGKADAEAGQESDAAAHLQAAWELTPQDDQAKRLDTLAILAVAYRKSGEADKAVTAYQDELERSEDGLYRVQLSVALAGFYQNWAQSVEQEQGIAAAVPLYENALRYLPDQQWEVRYRIVTQLDPVYREQGRFDKLIGYLESMEPVITDRKFRADVRRYRMELYRLWGKRLAAEGKPDEAARRLGSAITLMTAQSDWSGLADLAGARGEALQAEPAFEAQVQRLREAESVAPDAPAANEARLAIVATRAQWGAFLEKKEKPKEALAQYSAARERLTPADWGWRRDLTVRMAEVHRKRGDRDQQMAMLEDLYTQAPAGEEKEQARQTLVEANLLWARELDQEKKPEEAIARYRKALELIDKTQWRQRYPIVQEMGGVMLRENDTRGLAALYEEIRDEVDDPALKPQIDLFLGQLYAKWADDTFHAKKYWHAEQRYRKAMEYLPPEQWELRVTVAKQLETIYDQDDETENVTKTYEALVPTLPEGETRRQYALYLGRLYWDKAQQKEPARKWLQAADTGGNDAISVEAAFVLTEITLAEGRTQDARAALEKLVRRNLKGSDWYVPVHYQLAVLYHQGDRLRDALNAYKRVVAADSAKVRKLYPKAIAQSRKQVSELEAYLRIRGGAAGSRIDSPAFIEKPPTPGPKLR